MSSKIFPVSIVFMMCIILNCGLMSSFWEPLYNPGLLNYRVDAKFDPEAGKLARSEYENKYGVRGERLIAEFGTGRYPTNYIHRSQENEITLHDYRKTSLLGLNKLIL